MKLFLLLLLSLQLLSAQAQEAQAREIALFQANGQPAANYNELVDVKNLKVGDVFAFADGTKFELTRSLGKGGTTRVYAVKPLPPAAGSGQEFALRLRAHSGNVLSRTNAKVSTAEFLKDTVEGFRPLKEAGIPVPELKYHYKQEYVLTEIIPHDFDGTKFFQFPENIPRETLKKAEASLERFAATVAKFEKIGDFKPGQLVYNIKQDKWYLLDWTNNHDRYRGGGRRESMFSPGSRFAKLAQEFRRNPKTNKFELMPPTKWQLSVLKRLDDKIWEGRGNPAPASADCKGFFARMKQGLGL